MEEPAQFTEPSDNAPSVQLRPRLVLSALSEDQRRAFESAFQSLAADTSADSALDRLARIYTAKLAGAFAPLDQDYLVWNRALLLHFENAPGGQSVLCASLLG